MQGMMEVQAPSFARILPRSAVTIPSETAKQAMGECSLHNRLTTTVVNLEPVEAGATLPRTFQVQTTDTQFNAAEVAAEKAG